MRFRLPVVLVAIMLLVSACNLGSPDRATEEPLATGTAAAGRPTVTILAPSNGESFDVDEPIVVSIVATDSVGVTRAQLFADGQIVNTISSASITGDVNFSGELTYTPRTTGQFRLQVLAYRGSTASDPDEIVVTVNQAQDNVIVTTRPLETAAPIIPNDGVCRALTTVALNFRSEPTTERDNVITVLPTNTLAPIIARLGDNSWWKLSYNGRVGWVSAQFTTIYGNCSAIPVETFLLYTPTPTMTPTPTNTPLPVATDTPRPTATPGTPDLIITSIVGELVVTIPAGETEVTEQYAITVTNLGIGPSGQFSVTMRVDTTDFELVVSNLNAGESVVLTQNVTFETTGFFDIRVDADPTDDVDELSEVNNRGDITVEVQAG